MLLSADRHPAVASVAPALVPVCGERAGRTGAHWAAVIFVNFACNSCLIVDRTIAIRRRCAAVMRTKSGHSAGRATEACPRAPPCSRCCLHSFWLPECPPGLGERSRFVRARSTASGFPGGAIDDTVTRTIVGWDERVEHLVWSRVRPFGGI